MAVAWEVDLVECNNQLTQTIALIPAFEPAEPLLNTAEELLTRGFLVVVVDDGSGIQYQNIFEKLPTEVFVIHHPKNLGKGEALKTGYRFIKANFINYIIITADADGQQKITDIEKMATTYVKNPGTLLLGVREFKNHDVPLRSKFGNELTKKVYALITKQKVSDTQTGLRAFDQSLIDEMLAIPGSHFEYEMNVLLNATRENIKIVEMPIATIYENNNQSSHFNPIKDSITIYGEVLKFASSSLISFALDLIIFTAMITLTHNLTTAVSVTISNVIARLISASVNFTINRRIIFKDNSNVATSATKYALLAMAILIGNTAVLNLLTMIGMNPIFAKVATELAFFIISYVVQKHFVFAKKSEVTR